MALCSVADVRAYCSPVSLTDSDISDIITLESEEIAAKTGASASSTDARLKWACIHGSIAAVMKKARSNGELAAGVDTGNYKQQNTGLIDEIRTHEDEKSICLRKYQYSSGGSYALPFGRVGIKTVNNQLR